MSRDMLATTSKVNHTLLSLLQEEKAFALYRLPGKTEFHLMVSERNFLEVEEMDFEVLPSGFAFVPFDQSKLWFLPADYHFTSTNDGIDLAELNISVSKKDSSGFQLIPSEVESDQEIYMQKVDQLVKCLKNNVVRKVVLSRRKKVGTLAGNDYYSAFQKLCKTHSDAMVSLVYFPLKQQIWLGATPEILVKQDKDQVFTTMSLAGTQSAFDANGNEIRPIDALWTHKEIEEQALVGRYIINCLKKIRVREFEEEGPKTVKAGKLLHLRTYYIIDNKEVNYPNLSSVMLNLLHPTPAICGMPKEPAEKLLAEVEGYDREFYSGYLGPINVNEESHLFVNLRTMKIENGEVYTYAGGGITAESQPGKEWCETELKMGTVKGAFDNIEKL